MVRSQVGLHAFLYKLTNVRGVGAIAVTMMMTPANCSMSDVSDL
jgi:hypothetical protein